MANTTDYTRLLDGYALLAIKAYIANNYAAKSHTHDDRYLKLSGGNVTGPIQVTLNSGNSGEFKVTRGNYTLWFGVGSGDINRGIYDATNNNWMIYRDASTNVYINGAIYENGAALSSKYLGKTATAADSSKLNGQAASYYLNYNNLTNKPTIPSVSNATITIKQTGLSDQTFTLNGSATTITLADTNTWRPLGTGASDACAGNDSRLSDARPASDVYSWAKASTKPSYTHNEIGAGVLTIGDGANRLMFRTNTSYANGVYYSTPGNEALVFATKNSVTSWIFATTDPTQQSAWTGLTPSLQIKNGRVTINKLIAGGTDAAYNLDVNGTLNATTIYQNGSTLASTYLGISAKAADSSKLDGHALSYFITTDNIGSQSVYHAANSDYATDSGYASNSAALGGNGPAYYLNYNNFTNTPSAVLYTSQSLTNAQKTQARTNIGAGTSSLAIGTTASTAAAGNHTHTLSIASGGTASINLAANTTYTLTAGGKTYAFKTPASGGYYSNQYNETYYLTSNSGASLWSEDIQAGMAAIGLGGGNATVIGIGWPGLASGSFKRSLLFTGNRVDLTLIDRDQNYLKGLSIDMYDDDYYSLHIRANEYSDLYGSVSSENATTVNLHAWAFEVTPHTTNSAVTNKKYVSLGVVMHNISYTYSSNVYLRINIRGSSASDAVITSYANLCSLLYYAGHRSKETCLTCSGRYSSYTYVVLGVFASAYNSGLTLVYCTTSSNSESTLAIANGTIKDTISASLVP